MRATYLVVTIETSKFSTVWIGTGYYGTERVREFHLSNKHSVEDLKLIMTDITY